MAAARTKTETKTKKPVVGPNDRATLDRATGRIRELMERIAETYYELGLELKRVSDTKLYQAGGHRTFGDYLAGAVELSPPVAFKLIRIVERFSKAQATSLGFERLEAAVRLTDATPEEEDPRRVATLAVPTGKRGKGGRRTKPLAHATVAEIDAAARAARARTGAKRDRRSRPAEGDRFAAALEKTLGKAGWKAVRVRARKSGLVRGSGGGEAGFVVDILGLAPAAAERAAGAVAKVRANHRD